MINNEGNCVCNVCGHDETACSEEETLRRAKDLIVYRKQASAALLQRDLKISYESAARALDILELQGLIGPADGAKPRDVHI